MLETRHYNLLCRGLVNIDYIKKEDLAELKSYKLPKRSIQFAIDALDALIEKNMV